MTDANQTSKPFEPTPVKSGTLIVAGLLYTLVNLVALGSVVWANEATVIVVGVLALGLILGIGLLAVGFGWIPAIAGLTRAPANHPPGGPASAGQRR